jgi:UDP-N-acetylglucosamine:LPS N-acetylglucosamine transferase
VVGKNMVKKDTVFLFYGEGGHKAEMESLLSGFSALRKDVNYIGLAEGRIVIKNIKNYHLIPMRNKYNKYFILFLLPCALIYNTLKVLFLVIRYRPKGIISTGPGSVLFPAVLCRIFRKKVVYIETCSRFNSRSMTGKLMYFIANRFYVQNAELLALYPNSIYAGLLL